MDITSNRIPATPRSKYARYGYGSNNISVSGGGGNTNIDTSNFVKLKGQTSQSIEGAVAATGDIIAYQTNPEAGDFQFPIASTDALGTIKVGNGLKINEDGTLSVDGEIGGGITEVNWGDILNKPIFANVATTGSYNDLTNKPTIPTNNNQLTNGAGYITGINLSMWNGAATSVGNKTIGNSTNGNYIDIVEDLRITQNCTFNKTPKVGNTNIALVTDIHTHSNKSYLDSINQNLSTSSNVQHAQVKSTGEVIAYSTGAGTQSPFKYWKPSVSSSGVLSWTNSTSETTPSSVNIKGQGVTYQWSGTSLRLGTINSGGSTTWGSYVNLKGDSGSGSGSWNGGQVSNTIITPNLWINTTNSGHRLAVNGSMNIAGISIFNDNATFRKSNTNTRIWGNAIDAWSDTTAGRPRLWVNYYKPSGWSYQSEFFIGNGDGNGTQVATINADGNGKILIKNGTGTLSDARLKTIFNKQENILDRIQDINVYDYTRNDDEDKILRTGVLAQEVAKVFPTLAVANYTDEVTNERYYTVDYATLGAVISIGGCKELHSIIKEQQVKINELESRLASLETKTI